MIAILFILFLAFLLFLLFLGLVFEGSPVSFVFIFAASVLLILFGAALYSEGVRDESNVPIDVITVDDSVTQIDFNSSRAVYRTTQNDLIVAILAPCFFYGGIMGLIFLGAFLFKAVRS